MQFSAASTLEKREESDVLILPFWKGKKGPEPLSELGKLVSLVQAPIHARDFTGKEGDLVWVYGDAIAEKRILLLGLGEKEHVTLEKYRCAYGSCARACRQKKAQTVSILFPIADQHPQEKVAAAIGEGFLSAQYAFDQLKHDSLREDSSFQVDKIIFINCESKAVLKAVNDVQKIMKGVYLARNLVNGNAADVTPEYLGEVAKSLAKGHRNIKVEVHDESWIKKQGMGLFQAVSQASIHPPRFIVLRYQGDPDSSDHTVIVGKGVTFDTGGLHVKPLGGMETQRSDMSGAAVVFGVIQALSELKLPVNVTAVVASCENAIGSLAYRPGDVYKSYAGKTVEVTNTDAEGRLILADALAWSAKQLRPSRIIDLATLTGAMVVALGSEVFGFMSNSDPLAAELFLAGERTHERCWRFPLYEEYKDALKSDLGDIKNFGGRDAGAVLGAIFLHEFVGATPWAHFDIAGVSYLKENKRYIPKAATGIGVRLLVDFFQHLCDKGSRRK